jgi:hypothetical protein
MILTSCHCSSLLPPLHCTQHLDTSTSKKHDSLHLDTTNSVFFFFLSGVSSSPHHAMYQWWWWLGKLCHCMNVWVMSLVNGWWWQVITHLYTRELTAPDTWFLLDFSFLHFVELAFAFEGTVFEALKSK